jgi:hypothetical protein
VVIVSLTCALISVERVALVCSVLSRIHMLTIGRRVPGLTLAGVTPHLATMILRQHTPSPG